MPIVRQAFMELHEGLRSKRSHGGGVMLKGRQVHTVVRVQKVSPPLHRNVEEEGKARRPHRHREVHRPRVVGDSEARTLHECRQLIQLRRGSQPATGGGLYQLLREVFLPGPPDDEGGTPQREEFCAKGSKHFQRDSSRRKARAGVNNSERLRGHGGKPRFKSSTEAGLSETHAIIVMEGKAQRPKKVKALKDFRRSVLALRHSDVGEGVRNGTSGPDDGGVGSHPPGQQTGLRRRRTPVGTIDNDVPAKGAKFCHLFGERKKPKLFFAEGKEARNAGVSLEDAGGFGMQKQVDFGMGSEGFEQRRHQQSLADAVVHAHQQHGLCLWKFVCPQAPLGAPQQAGSEFADEGFGP